MRIFETTWYEDDTNVALNRVCAHDASGDATGRPGEGYWVQQADVDSISCEVFDVDDEDNPSSVATPTIDATAIDDTPATNNALWPVDNTGYNFLYSFTASVFTTGGKRYRAEFTITLTTGTALSFGFEGVCTTKHGS